ncbi:fumarylacetoacetate hydrolase family protein [Clostridium cylindrosporum]|uniref:2-keto-4-pentenoate hydratase/2-oxohepta-3-ene-1,7-dioic acid hydratase n=1 Tax=Clostridium cylindrosporum DSM 605 TaxID=1121307 RepID=A0A0J8D9Y1_CLOCY|nr:fumarylacetoacetate hydrolase family protein [Clostridium cylindrosporum]KMT21119.1 2-keto-4-pentenoate hydratase/2-oxohepta-3-ene-1,7-dioic acid hydratase [Clostridium cylindrosporum DSM 605]
MLFASFIYKGDKYIGIVQGDNVIPIKDLIGKEFASLIDLIENFSAKYIALLKDASGHEGIKLSDVVLTSPILHPKRNVICIGKNYKEHIDEIANSIDAEHNIPEHPVFFTKMVDKSVGPFENIKLHKEITSSLDYEAELGIIIGQEGSNIPKNKVHKYIFGYTIINDISARDIQRKHVQWFRGKSLDGTCPIGPYVLHKDSIPYPPKLKIQCRVNDNLRQDSTTEKLIFDIDTIVSELSKGITLKRGDIISTGTPDGVGMGMNPPKYLKEGDKVECYIENIGYLINTVK